MPLFIPLRKERCVRRRPVLLLLMVAANRIPRARVLLNFVGGEVAHAVKRMPVVTILLENPSLRHRAQATEWQSGSFEREILGTLLRFLRLKRH